MPTELLVPTPVPDIVDAATRREFLALMAAAGLLASCGSGAPARPADGATRTVIDAYGKSIEVPAAPQRVVAADNSVIPWVLELGVIPVAGGSIGAEFAGGRDFDPALYRLGAGEVQPFSRNEPNLELLASLEPDLIVVSQFVVDGRVEGGAGAYGGLAPVVAVDTSTGPFESLRSVGRILGRERRAEEKVDEVMSAISARAGAVGVKTVSFVNPASAASFYAYTTAEASTGFLAGLLGVESVPGPEGADESGSFELSMERLGDLTGKAIVILDRAGETETVTGHPLWSALPAVQADRVHNAGTYLTYAGNSGLAALRNQLIGIADFLADID